MRRKIIARQKQQAYAQGEDGKPAIRLRSERQFVPVKPGQIEADNRDQQDMGVEFAVESKAGELKQRPGETDRQHGCANGQLTELPPEQRREHCGLGGNRRFMGFRMRFQKMGEWNGWR